MIAALGFFTVLPVRLRSAGNPTAMLLSFPLVGAAVGGLWLATALLAGRGLPAVTVAALVVFVDLVVTGALHLDAVGDVGDGFAARHSGAEAATAMADPRIGSVGAATLGAVLLVRFGALVVLVEAPLATALWLVPVVGRTGMNLALWISPAREGSLASPLIEATTRGVVAGVVLLTAAAGGLAVLTGAAAVPVALAAVAGLLVALALTRLGIAAFGRSGGDLVGAAGIAAETVALLVLAWGG